MAVESMAIESVPRRDQFTSELIDLFLAEGFLSFSIEHLAAHLRCSKSTVYSVAPSKEQIVTTVVRAFFRRATDRVEARTTRAGTPADRIGAYLEAISEELKPASAMFFADLDHFGPAKEIYKRNTQIAASRVQELVAEALHAGKVSPLNAKFVGAVAGQTMELIHRGQIEAATGLDDSKAYRALADLIVAGMKSPTV
ncbi:MAG: TetR/AcrR family transcriptional regulator [Aeromicrobium sp.]